VKSFVNISVRERIINMLFLCYFQLTTGSQKS